MTDTFEKLKKEFKKLGLGEHFYSIYRNKDEQLRAIIPFMAIGLENNEKCVYIVDDRTKEEILEGFKKSNIDIKKYIETKQFEFLIKEDTYLKEGYFDPDKMIELLKASQKKALKDGYAGLRVAGEMTWIFTKLPGVEKLLEYEAKLNYFFPKSKSTAICQYNENKFKPEVLIDIIHVHPKVIIYGLICENPYYMPSDEFLARLKGSISPEIYKRVKDDIIGRENFKISQKEAEGLHKQLSALVESSDDAIIGKDLIGNILSWNNGAERIYGYSAKEIIGRHISILIPRDRPDELPSIYRKISIGECVEHFETMRIRKDGKKIYVALTVSPIKNEAGNIIGASSIARDITRQKEFDEILRESEEKFRVLFESSKDAIMLLDEKGFFDCNPTTLKIFGCKSREEFIAKHPGELSPLYQPDGRDSKVSANEHISKALETGSDFFEWQHMRIDGTVFYASVLLSRIRLKEKDVLQATVRDITNQKLSENELKQANEEWSRTFNSISDLIFIQDKDNKIVKANKAFFEALNLGPQDVIGKKCYEIVHKMHKPWPNCPFEKTKLDLKNHSEEVIDTKQGVSFLVTISPIFNDKGEFVGGVHIAKDITERKKTEEELKKKIETLERFQKITVGRELKMKELKTKIYELETVLKRDNEKGKI